MAHYLYSGRTELRKAALKRFQDAQSLFQQQRWRGAMYMAGYSIECRLKAQLMEKFRVNHLDELAIELEQRLGKEIKPATHNIEVLVGLSGISDRLQANKTMYQSFLWCNRWKPQWRYNPDDGTQDECESFMQAVKVFASYISNNI